jgi:hypothetical protein
MLLTLYSLWEQEAAGNDVIVSGEGVAANPQIGAGLVLVRRGEFGGIFRRLKPRERGAFVPVPVDVEIAGEGVRAYPHVSRGAVVYDVVTRGIAIPIYTYYDHEDFSGEGIGIGAVIIKVDFSDEELVALLLAA